MTQSRTPVVAVGVDGSPDSMEAVRWAQRYAEATGAMVKLVTTWEWPEGFGTPFTSENIDASKNAQAVAEKVAAELSLPADRVQVVVKEGPARQVLVQEAESADLLVVGSRGHSRIGGLLLGSVSSYCVHHATVPVVVAR